MNYQELNKLREDYFKVLSRKTLLLHKKVRDIKSSGSAIEIEIRSLLKELLPSRYRVTNGFIISVKDRESVPVISNQVDVIIVDEFVNSKIFNVVGSDGAEIVPLESVVGVL